MPTQEVPVGQAADQYQAGRGAARYRGERPATTPLVDHSLAWWRNEGIKDYLAGIPSRTGTETIFYGADGSPLPAIQRALMVGSGGTAPTSGVVRVAPAAPVRVAPAAPAPAGLGAYVPAPGDGPVVSYAPQIGPNSASMAIGPHGEVLSDLLPLFLLLTLNGGQQRAPYPAPRYDAYGRVYF